jgi:predicted nucleic acid-binding protein
MGQKTKAYLDSSALIAFLDSSDSFHKFFVERFSESPHLISTVAVVIETQGWFLKRFDARRAFQFMSFVEDLKILKVHPVDTSDIKSAKMYLKKFLDQPLTLVDALGLHTMEKHRISECWSTDRHLGLTGKRLVIHG